MIKNKLANCKLADWQVGEDINDTLKSVHFKKNSKVERKETQPPRI